MLVGPHCIITNHLFNPPEGVKGVEVKARMQEAVTQGFLISSQLFDFCFDRQNCSLKGKLNVNGELFIEAFVAGFISELLASSSEKIKDDKYYTKESVEACMPALTQGALFAYMTVAGGSTALQGSYAVGRQTGSSTWFNTRYLFKGCQIEPAGEVLSIGGVNL